MKKETQAKVDRTFFWISLFYTVGVTAAGLALIYIGRFNNNFDVALQANLNGDAMLEPHFNDTLCWRKPYIFHLIRQSGCSDTDIASVIGTYDCESGSEIPEKIRLLTLNSNSNCVPENLWGKTFIQPNAVSDSSTLLRLVLVGYILNALYSLWMLVGAKFWKRELDIKADQDYEEAKINGVVKGFKKMGGAVLVSLLDLAVWFVSKSFTIPYEPNLYWSAMAPRGYYPIAEYQSAGIVLLFLLPGLTLLSTTLGLCGMLISPLFASRAEEMNGLQRGMNRLQLGLQRAKKFLLKPIIFLTKIAHLILISATVILNAMDYTKIAILSPAVLNAFNEIWNMHFDKFSEPSFKYTEQLPVFFILTRILFTVITSSAIFIVGKSLEHWNANRMDRTGHHLGTSEGRIEMMNPIRRR